MRLRRPGHWSRQLWPQNSSLCCKVSSLSVIDLLGRLRDVEPISSLEIHLDLKREGSHVAINIAVRRARVGQLIGSQVLGPPINDEEKNQQLIRGLHNEVLPHCQVYQRLIPSVGLLEEQTGFWVFCSKGCRNGRVRAQLSLRQC